MKHASARRKEMKRFQQFIARVVDERGDPVPDYNIELYTRNGTKEHVHRRFSEDVHVYGADPSLRSFHVDVGALLDHPPANLWLRVLASSGSRLVDYHGYGSEKVDVFRTTVNDEGKWDAEVDLTATLTNPDVKLFYPFTTTLVELTLNREPQPLSGRNNVFWFRDRAAPSGS